MLTSLPEDITTISEADLADLEASLVAEFDKNLDEKTSDLALLTELADAIDAVRGESKARVIAAEAAAQAVAALAERVRAADEVVAESDPEEGEDEDDEAEAEEATVITDTPEAAEAETTETERELVTASANTQSPKAPSASAVARRTTTPEVAKPAAEVVITAAADVPGFAGGSEIDTLALAKALHAKARTLSNGSGYVPVASVNLPLEHKVGADMAHNLDVIAKATAPEALTAAGWCAPSQNLYTLFGVDAGDGLLDLPTVQVTRGGLNVPSFIGIGEATDGLWSWTEEDPGTEATKPCLQIPCPDFTDYRLQAAGLCLTNGNLTDRAFPELTSRFIALAINAHLHRLSGLMVAAIQLSLAGMERPRFSSPASNPAQAVISSSPSGRIRPAKAGWNSSRIHFSSLRRL